MRDFWRLASEVKLECAAQGLLIFKATMDTDNSRRSFLKGSAIAGAAFIIGSPAFVGPLRASVIVVGAGAFGGWSALQLLRKGAKVLLLDSWGPEIPEPALAARLA